MTIESFSPGSAPGFDDLRPQHLQEMIQKSSTDAYPKVLWQFVNLVLAGGVPMHVRHIFFGASLNEKKEGGLRPIAIGLTLRKLVLKGCKPRGPWSYSPPSCRWEWEIEAVQRQHLTISPWYDEADEIYAHSYISSALHYPAIAKLDFENVFNTVRRDCILNLTSVSRWNVRLSALSGISIVIIVAFTTKYYSRPFMCSIDKCGELSLTIYLNKDVYTFSNVYVRLLF